MIICFTVRRTKGSFREGRVKQVIKQTACPMTRALIQNRCSATDRKRRVRVRARDEHYKLAYVGQPISYLI